MPRQRSSASHHDGGRESEPRRRIAVEAARLISEHGIRDFYLAKRKAAERLGIFVESALPKNSQVEEALREHQRLFAAGDQPQRLRELRESAREALLFFAAFEPLLVGAVLDGSADRHSAVCLQVFSDEAEAVARFLGENAIPYEEHDRELRLTRDKRQVFPVFVFRAGATPVDLTVLPVGLRRQPPLDRDGEKPMRRATLAAVEELLTGGS